MNAARSPRRTKSGHHARDHLKYRRDAKAPRMPDPCRTACTETNMLARSSPPNGSRERH